MTLRSACLLLALTACQSPPHEPSQQALEAIVVSYAEDPAVAFEAISALASDGERVLAVEALTLRHGAAMLAQGGCEGVPAGAPARRCAEILERAHLFSERGAAPAVEPKDREPLRCGRVDSPALCARAAALEAVAAGGSEPWNHCEGVPTPTLRHECAFELGEAIVRQRGVDGYGAAVLACEHSGPFEPNCLDHVSAQLARDLVVGWEGACPSQLAPDGRAALASVSGVFGAHWDQRDSAQGERLASWFVETVGREALAAAGAPPPVKVEGPPPYDTERVVLVRYAVGGLLLDAGAEGPGADAGRAQAARLAGLARVLIDLEPDVVLIEQLEDPAALSALRQATACLGGHKYSYAALSSPQLRAGVLSRYPLKLHPQGSGVQLAPQSPYELVVLWSEPEQPLSWLSEVWRPDPDGPPGPREHSLPFVLDPQGQPMPWNPSAKRGYSDRLPELVTLVRAAGSPR
jgi:hypothetical protein